MTPEDLRPRQDSNLRTRLRRPALYPLSYEGLTFRAYQRPRLPIGVLVTAGVIMAAPLRDREACRHLSQGRVDQFTPGVSSSGKHLLIGMRWPGRLS